MLQESEIKYVFNEPVLQVGDILLMNTYHEGQRAKMKGCVYDHAAIYAGDAFLLEADGCGVTQNHIYSYGFKEAGHACVLRLKNHSPKALQDLILNARTQLGNEFSALEAQRTLLYKNTNKVAQSKNTFCSRYVAMLYQGQGYNIARNPFYCAPDDFLSSDLLTVVENGIQPATEEMMPTIMQKQEEREDPNIVLQEMLMKFKNLYGVAIPSVDELNRQAILHPELDDKAIEIMDKDVKFFNFKEYIQSNFPWLDDDDAFFEHFPSVESILFFINNQFLHFDKTYLPLFARNVIVLKTISLYAPKSRFIMYMHQGADSVYQEALRVRERLADLYEETCHRNLDEFDAFVKNYGLYQGYDSYMPMVDLSFIIDFAMKYGFPKNNIENKNAIDE